MWVPELGLISGNLFGTGSNPDTPQALRQKIALAMLMQKRKAPSNLGEGLSAIGDSLGDIGMMRRIEGEAAAAEQTGQAAYDKITGEGVSAAPAGPSPVQAAAISAPSGDLRATEQSPTDQTPIQGNVQEGGPPRGMLVRPGISMPAAQPGLPPARPAQPIPAGQQQADDASGLYRMPEKEAVDDWRAQNPLPQNIPPPGAGAPRGLTAAPPAGGRPSVADYGQKLALAPTPPPQPAADALAFPPVVAMGGEPRPDDPRREAALSLLRQQGGGQTRSAAPSAPAPQAMAPPDQNIAAAPPAAPPIAKIPQPQVAQAAPPIREAGTPEAGYVTPARSAGAPPPTMTKQMQDIQNMIRNTPASQRDSVAAQLKPLYDNEAAKLAQAHEVWKGEQTQNRALELEREKQLATQAERINASRKAQKELNQPALEDIQGKKVWDPVAQVYRTPRTETPANPNAPPDVKLTAEQSKALKFHGWTSLAEEQMQGKEGLLAQGLAEELKGKVPFVGNKLQAAEYRRVRAAAQRFVQGFLRDTSGAVIGPEEMVTHTQTFLPRNGDDPGTMADKRAARAQIINGLYAEAGPGREIADWEKTRRGEDVVLQQAKLNREMDGKDKSKTYEKNGVFRKWNGTAWEEH